MRVFLSALAFLVPAAATAGDCRALVRQRVVVQQVHAAVVAPVVALQPYQVAVPVQPVAVPTGTYYQVGQQLRDAANEERVAQRVAQLLAPQLEQFRQQLQQPMPQPQQFVAPPMPQAQAPAQAPQQPAMPAQPYCPGGTCPLPGQGQMQQPPAQQFVAPPPQPGPAVANAQSVLQQPGPGNDLDARVLAYFQAKCYRCHKPEKMEGGVDLSTLTTASPHACEILKQILNDTMPKGGPPANEDERYAVLEWFRRQPKAVAAPAVVP